MSCERIFSANVFFVDRVPWSRGMTMSERKRSGFTLIELLVVVAIIGLLATISIISFSSARMKARDAKRMADLKRIGDALEIYYQENGYYPPSSCGWDCNGYYYSYDAASWDTFSGYLAPFIKLPVDPKNSGCPPWGAGCNSYAYGNVGRTTWPATYDLTAQLEDPNSPYRCGVKDYRFFFNHSHWCAAFGGSYSDQIFELSPDW